MNGSLVVTTADDGTGSGASAKTTPTATTRKEIATRTAGNARWRSCGRWVVAKAAADLAISGFNLLSRSCASPPDAPDQPILTRYDYTCLVLLGYAGRDALTPRTVWAKTFSVTPESGSIRPTPGFRARPSGVAILGVRALAARALSPRTGPSVLDAGSVAVALVKCGAVSAITFRPVTRASHASTMRPCSRGSHRGRKHRNRFDVWLIRSRWHLRLCSYSPGPRWPTRPTPSQAPRRWSARSRARPNIRPSLADPEVCSPQIGVGKHGVGRAFGDDASFLEQVCAAG